MYELRKFDDRRAIVVLALTEELAMAHGARVRLDKRWEIIPLTQRADIYDMYGHVAVPFDVVPGTPVLPWHAAVKNHIAWGRLKPIREVTQRKVVRND